MGFSAGNKFGPKPKVKNGDRYGRLLVLDFDCRKGDSPMCLVQCDCGTQKLVVRYKLTSGRKLRSCGCLRIEHLKVAKPNRTHGMSRTPEFRAWYGAMQRCFSKSSDGYPAYGGRGITMCGRWRNSFMAFFEDMGLRPSSKHSLDRINNDGNYEPGNCRWTTADVQIANRRPSMQWAYKSRAAIYADSALSFGS